GPHAPQRSAYRPGKIERAEEHRQIGEALRRLVIAGVRGSGDDDVPLRMSPAKRHDDLPQEMNLADADAVKPGTGLGGFTQEGAAADLGPQAAAVFARGQRLVNKPRRKEQQSQQTDEIEEV